jgi:uncharacterized membrane protein
MAFQCPFCGKEGITTKREGLSGAGWAVFIVLIFVCLPLCWLPFVIDGCKEEVRRCASCGAKLP